MLQNQEWESFTGRLWKEECNVRDFIQNNYTQYDGDESFLAAPTDATNKLWDKLQALQKAERDNGGVLKEDADVVSSITSYGPGYIDPETKDLEQIVGLQTDEPLKRAFMPYGGIKMAEEALQMYGYTPNENFHKIFTEYHKTHNQAVFDAYTDEMKVVRMPIPKEVILQMNMHIGAFAKPIVNVGDHVLVGQKIAEAGGYISAPVHSSVSGVVKKIENVLESDGTYVPAIFIETDGLQEISKDVKKVEVNSYESFVEAVKNSGIVGLGGAGFPTYVKFSIKDLSMVDTVIINGAECEPYITSDTRTMIDNLSDLEEGIKLIEKYLKVKHIIFGIENNKKAAIQSLNKLAGQDEKVEIKVLPALYPQGGEKVLIYNTTKRVVPEGKLPLDVGVVIINVTTLAWIARYIQTGMPLVEKVVTVDGSCVKKPQNVIVPIGTKIKDVFAFCEGFKEPPFKVMYGGPMMGIALPSLDLPITKRTNAILALNEKEARLPEASNCIRCGRCINHCPLHLDPPAFAKALELNNPEELVKLKINLCMECGVCSYVCPAKRPLVQNNRLAKAELKKYLNVLASKKKKEEEKQNENK